MSDHSIYKNSLNYKIIHEKKYIEYGIDNSAMLEAKSPLKEYSRVINLVESLKKTNQKIIVPLSGGVDSEVIAQLFVNNKIQFSPVIVQFDNGFNKFDTDLAFEFCRTHKLEPIVLNLDLDAFYNSETHLSIAEKYRCRSPQLATHLWMIEQIDGYYIFPYNPLPIIYTSVKKKYIGFPPLMYQSYETCLKANHRDGIPLMAIFDSKIAFSFLKHPLYLNSLFNEKYSNQFATDNYFFKCELYNQSSLFVQPRKYKATGFEHYRKYLNEKHNFRQADFFDQTYRLPMEKIVNDPCYPASANIDLKPLYELYCSYENTIE